MKYFFETTTTANYISFYFNKIVNDVINLKEKKIYINNIISFNSYVNLVNYTLDKNKILITYYIIYKILYSSMPNNITYTLKNEKIKYTEILIPENFINSVFSKKDFNIELNLINNNIITFNNNNIKTSTNFLISLNIYNLHSISYVIKLSDYEEYVYTSHNYGENFIQKTFDINTHYYNVKFFNKDFILCIVKNNKETFLRKIFLKNDDFEDIYHNNDLKSFDLLDNNNVLLLLHEKKDTLLLKLNLKTLEINIFFKFTNENFSLIKSFKSFIILMQKFNHKSLFISLNKNTLFISKISGKFTYMDAMDLPLEEVLILLLEDNAIKFLNFNSHETLFLNSSFIEGDILNCKFITPEKILLHEKKSNNIEYLSIITLSNYSKKHILETSSSIKDICINIKENIIYLSLKENNKFNVYYLDEKETLNLMINIDALSISLVCKL